MSDDDYQRYESALRESRESYETQIAKMESLDDKALRSVRTAVLILGFTSSVISFGSIDSISSLLLPTVLSAVVGIAALLVSAVVGVGTYTVTQYEPGVRPQDRDIARDLSTEEWYEHMLDKYDEWSQNLAAELEKNTGYLELTQLSLIGGVVALVLATVGFAIQQIYSAATYWLLLGISMGIGLLVLVGGFLYRRLQS